MIKTLGEKKYSPDNLLGTPKRVPKLKPNEIQFGSKVLSKEEIISTKSCEMCGFCTSKQRLNERQKIWPKKDYDDLSFWIADDSVCELDKNDPIFTTR